MDAEYLTDTSAVIKYLNGTFPKAGLAFMDKVVDAGCVLSFVTEIELLAWDPPKKADLLIYHQFVQESTVIGIDKRIVRRTIAIRKASGLKLPDALIAATAIPISVISTAALASANCVCVTSEACCPTRNCIRIRLA